MYGGIQRPAASAEDNQSAKVHRKDVTYKGYQHHATKDDSQYEIKSDTTDHVAVHKGGTLKRVR